MSITSHVRSDEHPLRQLIGSQVLEEKGSVLKLLKTILIGGHRED
jgi:hypothetical protein